MVMKSGDCISNNVLLFFSSWGGSGFITLNVTVMGLPAIDYNAYIQTRQYQYFLPDWAVVVLALVYVLLTLIDLFNASRSQARIVDSSSAPLAIKLSTGAVCGLLPYDDGT
jgi:hypothetical protein